MAVRLVLVKAAWKVVHMAVTRAEKKVFESVEKRVEKMDEK